MWGHKHIWIIEEIMMTLVSLKYLIIRRFWVQNINRQAFDETNTQVRLETAINRALVGNLKLKQAKEKQGTSLPKRARRMTVAPRVLIDNKASLTHTVIEVNGTDHAGLLHRLTQKIAQQNLQISAAKISTYGESIVDVFYVKDLFGLKVQSDRRLDGIRKAILAEMDPKEKLDPPPPPRWRRSKKVAAE